MRICTHQRTEELPCRRHGTIFGFLAYTRNFLLGALGTGSRRARQNVMVSGRRQVSQSHTSTRARSDQKRSHQNKNKKKSIGLSESALIHSVSASLLAVQRILENVKDGPDSENHQGAICFMSLLPEGLFWGRSLICLFLCINLSDDHAGRGRKTLPSPITLPHEGCLAWLASIPCASSSGTYTQIRILDRT